LSNTAHDIVGVILAAGKGSRMSVLPTRLPKPVLPVLGEPILYHQLRAMAEVGIRRVYVVVGERGYEVVRELERLPRLGLQIEYVEQTETHGIAHCVGCLERYLDEPFLLFLGDIFFVAPRLHEMMDVFSREQPDAVLAAIEETDTAAIRRNFCILTDESGRATRVIEKPRNPRSSIKGVGLYLFRPVVFDAIRRTPRTAMRDEYEITDSIQILIDDGYVVKTSFCVAKDRNVTAPADLLEINLEAIDRLGLDKHVGSDVLIESDAVIRHAVIGSRCRIGKRARVVDSVVFREVTVPEGAQIERAIVTEQGVLRIG